MTVHNLKIQAVYANAKLDGKKMFEIRKNDRDFKVGDFVKYFVIDSIDCDKRIIDKIYVITFITNYEQKEGYIVFGEKEVEENEIRILRKYIELY